MLTGQVRSKLLMVSLHTLQLCFQVLSQGPELGMQVPCLAALVTHPDLPRLLQLSLQAQPGLLGLFHLLIFSLKLISLFLQTALGLCGFPQFLLGHTQEL